ncbi:hypothetical protein TB2_018576 [Malus domestica]
MGFPVGYTEVFVFPNIFLHTLSFLGFIRSLIFSLFHFLGLSEFLEIDDIVWPESESHLLENPSTSALLIKEFLLVINFRDVGGDPGKSCAVYLYEFEVDDEIRCLTNYKHIFHRACTSSIVTCF